MADFFNCDPDEVVFGPNMTTLTYAISRSIGRELHPGDEILLTHLDHDANISPWRALEEPESRFALRKSTKKTAHSTCMTSRPRLLNEQNWSLSGTPRTQWEQSITRRK